MMRNPDLNSHKYPEGRSLSARCGGKATEELGFL